MAGFRTSSKLSQYASNLVYTSPGGGTSSSVSISVVAPTKAKVFVQQAALGGVALSSAQTYSPQTGTFGLTNQINATWLKNNAILRWTTHNGYGSTSRNMVGTLNSSSGNVNNKYRDQHIYAWGEIKMQYTLLKAVVL